MTQLSFFDDLIKTKLSLATRPNSKTRLLAEWLLSRGWRATTAELAEWGRENYCTSVFERLRVDLRGRLGWKIEARPLNGKSKQWEYIVVEI